MSDLLPEENGKGKKIRFQDGRIYFTKSGERFFFLMLTAVVAVVALLHQIGTP